MKMSKRERKAYNLGRENGYIEGYKDGLHDGNPFISLAEGLNKAIGVISEKLTDPEFIEYCKRVTAEEEMEQVEANQEPPFKWVHIESNPFCDIYECPVCGYKIHVTEEFMKTLDTCENCGAYMKGATE